MLFFLERLLPAALRLLILLTREFFLFAITDHFHHISGYVFVSGDNQDEAIIIVDNVLTFTFPHHHFLQDQYRAVNLSLAVSHLCLALKLLRLLGLLFLIFIFGSPKRMIFSFPFFQALTTNFLDPPEVRLGLLQAIFALFILVATAIYLKTFYCTCRVGDQDFGFF